MKKIIYDNIQKIAKGLEDDYTTGCLLNYLYFQKQYKMIAIYLRKQQALDADRKNYFGFFSRTRKSIVDLFCFNVMSI